MDPITDYISEFPEPVRERLSAIRQCIQTTAPAALELMAYGMPGYKTYGKPLVYFAGYKNHIGFYATPSGHAEFEAELSVYPQGKGSVQFPLDRPLPLELIQRMVAFRVAENDRKYKK